MKMKLSSKLKTRISEKDLRDYHEGDSHILSKSIGDLNQFFDKKRRDRWIR